MAVYEMRALFADIEFGKIDGTPGRNKMDNAMDIEKGLDYYIKLCQKQDKEIERLKKEKEWLIEIAAYWTNQSAERICEEMQQALKDGEDGKERPGQTAADKHKTL